jgi:hypothetical protein
VVEEPHKAVTAVAIACHAIESQRLAEAEHSLLELSLITERSLSMIHVPRAATFATVHAGALHLVHRALTLCRPTRSSRIARRSSA